MRFARPIAIGLMATLVGGVACRRKDETTEAHASNGELPPLSIRDDTANLILTWVDDKGDAHDVTRPTDVPESARDLVRVVLSDKDEGSHDLFYVVDLGRKGADGSYVARTMKRKDWEAVIEKRREAFLAKARPPSGSGSGEGSGDAPAGAGLLTVIIYGASWCHPCHEAAAYLKQKGIPYVLKDIEESESARVEMNAKLQKAGGRRGSIPVIDVGGELLIGFSKSALDQALSRAGRGTAL